MEEKTARTMELLEDRFLTVSWEESYQIIGVHWKAATSSMTDEDVKAELSLFAGQVEQKGARGILVDVKEFRHRMGAGMQEWRIKNISNRYSVAGVQCVAFLLPKGSQIPLMMIKSSPGEEFITRAFTDLSQAKRWLTEAQQPQLTPD